MHPMMPCEYDNPDSEKVDDWLKHGQIGTQKWMVQNVPNWRVMAKKFSTSHHPVATEPGFCGAWNAFTHHSELTLASTETVETIHVAEN